MGVRWSIHAATALTVANLTITSTEFANLIKPTGVTSVPSLQVKDVDLADPRYAYYCPPTSAFIFQYCGANDINDQVCRDNCVCHAGPGFYTCKSFGSCDELSVLAICSILGKCQCCKRWQLPNHGGIARRDVAMNETEDFIAPGGLQCETPHDSHSFVPMLRRSARTIALPLPTMTSITSITSVASPASATKITSLVDVTDISSTQINEVDGIDPNYHWYCPMKASFIFNYCAGVPAITDDVCQASCVCQTASGSYTCPSMGSCDGDTVLAICKILGKCSCCNAKAIANGHGQVGGRAITMNETEGSILPSEGECIGPAGNSHVQDRG